jgi:hypothetical protein
VALQRYFNYKQIERPATLLSSGVEKVRLIGETASRANERAATPTPRVAGANECSES